MTQWFESIDTNRDGLLDAKELQKALAMGNMKVITTCGRVGRSAED